MAGAAVFTIRVFDPGHFGADELEGFEAAAKMGGIAFRLHGKRRILRTAGNAVRVQRIIGVGKTRVGS